MIRGKPRSLKWRLVLRIAVLQGIMLTLLIVLIFAVMLGIGVIPHQYEGGTMDVLADAATRDADGGLALKETPALARLRANVPDLWFIIRDKDGHRLEEGAVPAEFQPFAERLDNISDARFDRRIGEAEPPDVRVRWIDTAAGNVQIMSGTKGELSLLRILMQAPNFFVQAILPLTGLMALSTLFVTPWVVHGALRGLGHAAAAAERIDIDQRGLQLPADSVPREVLPLVRAVNDALSRLDRGYERHKRFLTDAAHELRTPLGHLRGELEVCLMRQRSVEDYRDAMESALDECSRLTMLIENLLFTARAERAGQALHRECFEATQACAWIIEQQAAQATKRSLVVTLQGDAVVDADPILFRQALINVLTNAIRHAAVGSEIGIGLKAAPDHVEIRVHNVGEAIPAQHLPYLFDRFYQADAARRRGSGQGTGLGLSIVAAIMEMHGGTVQIASTPAAGTTVTMRFPRLASAGREVPTVVASHAA